MRYVLEWIVSFFVIGGLNILVIWILRKNFNQITSAIFSFIVVGLFVFLTAPYLVSFPEPALIYIPFLIFWFIVHVIKANREMSG